MKGGVTVIRTREEPITRYQAGLHSDIYCSFPLPGGACARETIDTGSFNVVN